MVSYSRSNAGAVLALTGAFFVWGCGGGDNGGNGGGTEPPTTGSLTVTVRADGTVHAGVTVERYAPGATTPTASAATGANGQATFANIAPGVWEIEIVLPDGFDLADGEDERKSATVVAGATATASFDMVDEFNGETIEAQDNLSFSRTNVSISAGTAVRWVNVGAMLHTVTPDGHSEWTAANLGGNGSTFTHTFDTPGTYDYYCDPHLANGMTGTITVN
jgi:plastocyanin